MRKISKEVSGFRRAEILGRELNNKISKVCYEHLGLHAKVFETPEKTLYASLELQQGAKLVTSLGIIISKERPRVMIAGLNEKGNPEMITRDYSPNPRLPGMVELETFRSAVNYVVNRLARADKSLS